MVDDTLPTRLTQFGDELERAITRELATPTPTPPLRHRPSRRRRMLVGAAAGCTAAGAVAAGITILATGSGGSQSAWAQHVLRAAEVALPKPAPNTIVHVSVTQTMTPAARRGTANAVPTVNAEGWFEQGAPWRQVTGETVPGGATVWQTDSSQTNPSVYDSAGHRMYVMPPLPSGNPHYTVAKSGKDGSFALRIDTSHGPVQQTIPASEARALRTGADQISWSEEWHGRQATLLPMVGPGIRSLKATMADQPNDTSLSFPAQLHRLLQSGHARVAGRVTVEGRAAIKIAILGADGKLWMTYYVDPTTYRPIELDRYGFDSPQDVTRLVFHTYQQLPITGNARLLRLPAAAGATIDRSATDYFRHTPATLFW
jgi:hypothetical protein